MAIINQISTATGYFFYYLTYGAYVNLLFLPNNIRYNTTKQRLNAKRAKKIAKHIKAALLNARENMSKAQKAIKE